MRLGLVCIAFFLCVGARADEVFVGTPAAQRLVHDGALVLDARKDGFSRGHVPGAVPIDWQDYRDGWGRTGRLSDDDGRLSRLLGALGVDDRRAVLVYGDAQAGFGEEGRIAWMLRYLGLHDVHVLDGGLAAWPGPLERDRVRPQPGIVTVHRDPSLRVTMDEVSAALRDRRALVLDVRTQEEWDGATPYHEARGGHIPGARLLPFSGLFGRDGHVVRTLDVPRDRPIYLYCTGGVRSALATMILRGLGYDAKNFDASFWGWSANASLPVTEKMRGVGRMDGLAKIALILVVSSSAVAHAADDFAGRAKAIVEDELARVHAPIDTRDEPGGYRWVAREATREKDRPDEAVVLLVLARDALMLTCHGFGVQQTGIRVDVRTGKVLGPIDPAALYELATFMSKTFSSARVAAGAALPAGPVPTIEEARLFRPSGRPDCWTLKLRRGSSAWTVEVDVPGGSLRSIQRIE